MSKKTIMLADNSYTIRRIVELSFSDEKDISLVTFENGLNLKEKLIEMQPHIVLVDIKLPEFSGYDVCKFVQENPSLSHTRVFLLKGGFEPIDENLLKDLRYEEIITKPFDSNALVLNIKKFLEGMPAETPPAAPQAAPSAAPPEAPAPGGGPESEAKADKFDDMNFSGMDPDIDPGDILDDDGYNPPAGGGFMEDEIQPSEEITRAQPDIDNLAPSLDEAEDNPFGEEMPGVPGMGSFGGDTGGDAGGLAEDDFKDDIAPPQPAENIPPMMPQAPDAEPDVDTSEMFVGGKLDVPEPSAPSGGEPGPEAFLDEIGAEPRGVDDDLFSFGGAPPAGGTDAVDEESMFAGEPEAAAPEPAPAEPQAADLPDLSAPSFGESGDEGDEFPSTDDFGGGEEDSKDGGYGLPSLDPEPPAMFGDSPDAGGGDLDFDNLDLDGPAASVTPETPVGAQVPEPPRPSVPGAQIPVTPTQREVPVEPVPEPPAPPAPEPEPVPPAPEPPAPAPEPAMPEPAIPEPTIPEPVIPEPATPEPTIPEPSIPEPSIPEPAIPEPEIPVPPVVEAAEPPAPPAAAPAGGADVSVSPDELLEKIGPQLNSTLEKMLWDIVPPLAEKIIKEEIERLKAEVEKSLR